MHVGNGNLVYAIKIYISTYYYIDIVDSQKKFRLLTLAAIAVIIIVISPSLYHQISQETNHGPFSTPAGIVKYFSIKLHNPASVSSPSPNIISLSVNSSSYSSYEASNLQNVEFFDSSGTVLSSFLVSVNSNTENNTIYLVSAPVIAAGSSVTIYIGFVAISTNLFTSTGPVSEAPQLSPVYGQYANGAMFTGGFQDFSGNSLPSGWQTAGNPSYVVNNGITVYPSGYGGFNYVGTITSSSSLGTHYAVTFWGEWTGSLYNVPYDQTVIGFVQKDQVYTSPGYGGPMGNTTNGYGIGMWGQPGYTTTSLGHYVLGTVWTNGSMAFGSLNIGTRSYVHSTTSGGTYGFYTQMASPLAQHIYWMAEYPMNQANYNTTATFQP